MENNRKPIFLSFFLISAVIILCLCLIIFLGAMISWLPGQVAEAFPTQAPTPFPVAELPQPANDSGSNIPLSLREEMERIQVQVIQERGLLPKEEIVRDFLTPEELRQNVETDFFESYTREDAETDRKAMVALGWIDAQENLLALYQDLYAEQIAGYYDNEEKAMYVIRGGDFGPTEKMTYAHEYTHALQDQVFNIKNGLHYGDEECAGQDQRCEALQALIEGDASLSEYRWQADQFGNSDYENWLSVMMEMESPVFDQIPAYFQQSLMFPYQYGLNFVNIIYDQSGWDGVNAVYQNPPVSAEQILHPSLYPDHLPVTVQIPDVTAVLPGNMQLLDEGELGEWDLSLVLSAGVDYAYQLSPLVASEATRGWGGDHYQMFGDPQDTDVVWIACQAWDTEKDAVEFFDAFSQYGDLRWGYGTTDKDAQQATWTAGAIIHTILRSADRTCWVDTSKQSLHDKLIPLVME